MWLAPCQRRSTDEFLICLDLSGQTTELCFDPPPLDQFVTKTVQLWRTDTEEPTVFDPLVPDSPASTVAS